MNKMSVLMTKISKVLMKPNGNKNVFNLAVISFRQMSNDKLSVDESQVAVLEKYKEQWWDVNGNIRALHSYNHIRVPFIREGLCKTLPSLKRKVIDEKLPLKDVKALEIGCGGGILTEAIARLGAKITGIDASDNLVEMAKYHAMEDPLIQENTSYVDSTIEEYCETHVEEYDTVVISEVLEHIPEKDSFIGACVRALKPGGSVFITTFNRTLLARLYGIFMFESVFKCIPKGTHDFQLFIGHQDTSNLLEKYNCETVCVKGINYNPILNKWYWVGHTQISYGLHAVKKV